MATAELSFTTKGKTPQKFESKPPPAQEWDAKIHFSKWEVRKKEEPGKFPYLTGPIELLNSSTKEGGKNRVIFHNLWTSLKQYESGFILVTKADQIVGLCRALGTEYEANRGNKRVLVMRDAEGEEVPVLAPQALLQWLQQYDGVTVRLKSKIEKGQNGYKDKGAVDYFVEDEASAEEESEEEVEVEESEAEESEEVEEVEEVEVEEEEAPQSPRKIKPGPKVQQGPTPKKGVPARKK
jgi:hypothetical protein